MNVDNILFDVIEDWFEEHPLIADIVPILVVLLVSFIVYIILKRYVRHAFRNLAKKTETQIDDILIEAGLTRLLYIVPVIIIHSAASLFGDWDDVVLRTSTAFISLIILYSIDAVLTAVIDIYDMRDIEERIPIKSHIQLFKIFVYVVGAIVILGQLTGKSPWLILSGIGVFTALLLLMFRDSILSFVACLQITSNDLFRVGDWLEVPKYGADGDVIDISLHTVKIQNWDKTITVIPTYKLLEESFKNWRGMSKSGGRRIKRAINIDVSSIKFCDMEMLEQYKKMQYIKDYIENKLEDIEKYNKERNIENNNLVDGRHITNIGTFRAYIKSYLRSHPKIHQDLTFLIRQLPPDSHGLPIEIYVFTNDTIWANYEDIQSDIFDHLLAVIPEFNLRLFQEPTGNDFKKIGETV